MNFREELYFMESTNSLPWIIFELRQQLYAISTERVTGISKMPSLTFVPNAPPEFLGVTSLRGNVTPVLELKRLLNLADNKEATAKAIALIAHKKDGAAEYVNEITRCLKRGEEFCVSDTETFFGGKFDKTFVSDRSEVSKLLAEEEALEAELLGKVSKAKSDRAMLREAEATGKKLVRLLNSAYDMITDDSYRMLIFLSDVPGSVDACLCFVVDRVRAVDELEMIEEKTNNRCLYMSGYICGVAHNEKIKGEILVTDDKEIVKMVHVYNEHVKDNDKN